MAKSGTPAQVKAKFKTWGDFNWYGMCAGLTHTVCRHFGYVTKADTAYPSAKAAYQAAKAAGKIRSTDPKKAPRGAIHYWAYWGKNSRGEMGDWGHVGVDMTGGGRDILNATSKPNDRYGLNAGTSTFAEIDGRVGTYLGWGTTYGREYTANILDPTRPKPSTPKPAAGGEPKPATPATPIQEEDDDMTVYVQAKGQDPVYEIKDGKRRQLSSPEWEIIKGAFEFAGRKVPYSKEKLSLKDVLSIPEAGK
ncbi:type IV pilus assembly protein FimV [Microbacterium sp. LMI1x-1-1.1]|uniref:type IV pilus assembly protein FimV n=1 Tax=Microbacterium sp. LMI1x-1-1.1 TaxID=3135246 RepID=UPI00341A2D67